MMTARLTAVIALVALAVQPVLALGMTSAAQFGPPTIRLEASDTLLATRQATVQLSEGSNSLALPLADLGVAAGDVVLQMQPMVSLRLAGVHTGSEGPRWIIQASRDIEAAIAMTYPVKGLSWAIEYAATLSPEGAIDLDASLRLNNGLKRDLEDARFIGEFARANLSLDAGQSITVEQPWLSAEIDSQGVERFIVYDKARHGDSAVELVAVPGEATARATALPAGSVRLYTAPEVGGEFIKQISLPYIPPHEPLEIALGPATGVRVQRSLDASKEVDKRLDARNKVALFDLEETWELEVRNLREGPVDLLIRERHEGAWKLEECSEDCERTDAETLIFDVTLEPNETRSITYRIRHQNRQP